MGDNMKYLKWFVKTLLISLLLLFSINFIGSYINLNIPINIYTIIIVMLLRVPGIIGLCIFFLL